MSDPRPIRIYKCTDAQLITASYIILENMLTHKADFLAERTDFVDPFAENFKIRIGNASTTNLGESGNEGPKTATAPLETQKELAREKVQKMKRSIEAKYNSNPTRLKEIKNAMGLNEYYESFYAGDDNSATALYGKMKTALDSPLKAELVAAGHAAPLFDNALAALLPITGLNVTQELEKGADLGLTDANINEFNAIHAITMDIANQGKSMYQQQPDLLDKFNFSKIVESM